MRIALLLAVLASCWALAAQATIYRWVDPDGTVHFSDQPHQGATEITVQEPQTYSAPKPMAGTPNNAAAAAKAKDAAFRYTNCSVGSPASESTIGDVDAMPVSLSVSPQPRPGDRISLLYDGQPVAGSGGGATGYEITPLDRGSHTLSVTITDPSGAPMCQSGPLTFYVRQPSVLAPQNPNSPVNRNLPTIH